VSTGDQIRKDHSLSYKGTRTASPHSSHAPRYYPHSLSKSTTQRSSHELTRRAHALPYTRSHNGSHPLSLIAFPPTHNPSTRLVSEVPHSSRTFRCFSCWSLLAYDIHILALPRHLFPSGFLTRRDSVVEFVSLLAYLTFHCCCSFTHHVNYMVVSLRTH